MPTINIPPRLRFVLYLAGVLGAVLVQYAMDKTWFGEAEMRLWSGVAAVLFTLAAAKTDLSGAQPLQVQGTVTSDVTGETGTLEAEVETDPERGAISWAVVLVALAAAVFLAVLILSR